MGSLNYAALIALVKESELNANKFYGEKQNASAGKLLRAQLLEISKFAKQCRKDVSEEKIARKKNKKNENV